MNRDSDKSSIQQIIIQVNKDDDKSREGKTEQGKLSTWKAKRMSTDPNRSPIRLDVGMVEWDVFRLRRFLRLICDSILCGSTCCRRKSSRSRYLTLPQVVDSSGACVDITDAPLACVETGADLVPVKISLLGDCRIGKTSFMMKYAGGTGKDQEMAADAADAADDDEGKGLQIEGLNLMDKIIYVRGARIIHSIWDVTGDERFMYHMPIACKDSSAILYMFDLTNRWTLNNVIGWYQQSIKWNKTAIPVLIGTKFDDFVKLPIEIQWAVVKQARAFARAMSATLFFSSTTHNINVNKIFKFITAKTFNLPWTVERNLKLGEPIIDF